LVIFGFLLFRNLIAASICMCDSTEREKGANDCERRGDGDGTSRIERKWYVLAYGQTAEAVTRCGAARRGPLLRM